MPLFHVFLSTGVTQCGKEVVAMVVSEKFYLKWTINLEMKYKC